MPAALPSPTVRAPIEFTAEDRRFIRQVRERYMRAIRIKPGQVAAIEHTMAFLLRHHPEGSRPAGRIPDRRLPRSPPRCSSRKMFGPTPRRSGQ